MNNGQDASASANQNLRVRANLRPNCNQEARTTEPCGSSVSTLLGRTRLCNLKKSSSNCRVWEQLLIFLLRQYIWYCCCRKVSDLCGHILWKGDMQSQSVYHIEHPNADEHTMEPRGSVVLVVVLLLVMVVELLIVAVLPQLWPQVRVVLLPGLLAAETIYTKRKPANCSHFLHIYSLTAVCIHRSMPAGKQNQLRMTVPCLG